MESTSEQGRANGKVNVAVSFYSRTERIPVNNGGTTVLAVIASRKRMTLFW